MQNNDHSIPTRYLIKITVSYFIFKSYFKRKDCYNMITNIIISVNKFTFRKAINTEINNESIFSMYLSYIIHLN